MSNTRSFSAIYLLACLATVLAIFAVNLLGNTTNFFPSPLHPPMSERAWKTRRLEEAVAASRAPRVIILGDSRVMQIQPAYVRAVTGKTTFNFGVSVATPTDFLAQLRYLLKIHGKPDLILVGVDEFTLAPHLRPSQVEILGHVGLFAEVPCPSNLQIIGRALSLCSFRTTRDSLLRLLARQRPKRELGAVDDLLLEDGYLIYCDKIRAIRAGTFDLRQVIREECEKVRREMESEPRGSAALDLGRLRQFEEFLALARERGIEVKVMLLPVHPDWAEQMFTPESWEERRQLQRYLPDACRKFGAEYRDFTDLRSYAGDPKEFYDGLHQTATNTRRMINALFGIEPRSVVARIPADGDILDKLPAVTTLSKE